MLCFSAFALPFGLSLLAVVPALGGEGWADLFTAVPGSGQALALSLWTAVASTAVAWWLCRALLAWDWAGAGLWRRLDRMPWLLATPHVAFAIGLVFLLSPSGWIWRGWSWAITGWQQPPPWITTQDPWGLSLILALSLKEVPFLLWAAAAECRRREVQQRWLSETAAAMTLGHDPVTAFYRVIWPQLRWRLRGPLWAVWSYGVGVIDVAEVIGPTHPPTLALLAWQAMTDPDPVQQQWGIRMALLLALLVWLGGLCVVGALTRLRSGDAEAGAQALCRRSAGPLFSQDAGAGTAGWPLPLSAPLRRWAPRALLAGTGRLWYPLWGIYVLVGLGLSLSSLAGVWPFPMLWPQRWSLAAWLALDVGEAWWWNTLWLALLSSAAALLWSVVWLEWTPPVWERRGRTVIVFTLAVPGVWWVTGLYTVAGWLGGTAAWDGVWLLLAHWLAVLPYVLLGLAPAYRALDPRYVQAAQLLGHPDGVCRWQVKWPLLRAPMAASAAIGIAVSVAQYLPTVYVGGGRWPTVTTEAVALAAGGQRQVAAAAAVVQWLLPVCAMWAAQYIGRWRLAQKGWR